ncbi:MAG TPA: glycosyltransferase family 39 protein, partial [Thermoanaerobaculia bacterium]|nr:glycosyltransferase family 39 protein [Thermoanaerobaculia bacterium]
MRIAPAGFGRDAWPEADVHFFSDVFHNRTAAECRLLARRSFEQLPRGGSGFRAMSRDARWIFLAGALLRMAVVPFLGPNGADNHYEIIEHLLREGRLPLTGLYAQSYHPPAYYLLGAPFALIGGPRGVQVLSLILSIANLWLLVRLLDRAIVEKQGRWMAMIFVATLPVFVLYSLLVSNDGLALLVGTVCLLAALRVVERPSVTSIALAGLVAGLALSTKGTLLGHVAVLGVLAVWVAMRRMTPPRAAVAIALFVALASILGAYKFVENQIHLGRPVVHNMEFGQPWVKKQQPVVDGPAALVRFDLPRLLEEPILVEREGRWNYPRSVPALLYGTFWYHTIPISNFRATTAAARRIAQATYLLALVPTILLVAGIAVALRRRPAGTIAVTMLLLNLGVVLAAGFRFDAFSSFHSRLLFGAMPALALALGWGVEWCGTRTPRVRQAAVAAMALLFAAFVAYYAVEIRTVVTSYL